MKILELRFKNLNSLYGEWMIDFTDPEYQSNGIFALTGPTGAGKSTILDAICLALYGATPRLGKITKSGNEIMSRQTGECYAEVVFQSQAGEFRCHWEQWRSRKKADGALQPPKHQIADARSGKLIETKISLVASVIEEKTGMDFDRFTRSILLAQGGFDTFLKANAEQKSKILEQITGTGIYSEISLRVHERRRDEKAQLDLLEAETSGIQILEPEREKEIELDLGEKLKQEVDLSGQFKKIGKALEWLKIIASLELDISALAQETHELNEELEAFKPQRESLDLANRAAGLEGPYSTLVALRKLLVDEKASLKEKEGALPDLKSRASTQADQLSMAEGETKKAKEALAEAAPLVQKIRALDQTLSSQAAAIKQEQERLERDDKKIDEQKASLENARGERATAEESMKAAAAYLKEREGDEWLVSGLPKVKAQLDNLRSKQRDLAQKEKDQQKAGKTLELAVQKVAKCEAEASASGGRLEKAAKNLDESTVVLDKLLNGKLLREYRAEKDSLQREQAYLKEIASLKDRRAKLEDGKPCPLCGSENHPFAVGNVPAPDAIEEKIQNLDNLIARAEAQDTENRKLEKAKGAAQDALKDSEKDAALAVSEKKAAETVLEGLKGDLEKGRADLGELKAAVSEDLQPLGITEVGDGDVSSLLSNLQARLDEWNKQVKNQTVIKDRISAVDSEIKRLEAVIKTQSEALVERREGLDKLVKDHEAGVDERKSLFGDQTPDEVEMALNKAIRTAEGAEKNARNQHVELQQQLSNLTSHIASLTGSIEQKEPELIKLEAEFAAALIPAGFKEEGLFLQARLPADKREVLAAQAGKLDTMQTELAAKKKDRESRLAVEKEKRVTDLALADLEPEFKGIEESLKLLQDAIAGLKHQLADNKAAKARVQEKQAAIEAQKKEVGRWVRLHGLIGSSDGKKFRNFAQGLTFELMVNHANRQLAKMTDRYLLIRDREYPLELNVVDNYQAGEVRSTRNLSGGESFIVSLTLALGLSSMASRKVRVDSLFLDEGFGTLDEDALETSLETLSGLQQGGKLIGVISHVPALKERIGTQISINPASGGRSRVSGPGCSQL